MAIQKVVTLTTNGALKLIDAGIVTSTGATDEGKLPVLDTSGRLDVSMMPTGIGADTKAIATSESLAAGNFVNIWNDAGTPKVRKADATTAGKEAHGFVIAAFTHPISATVYFEGTNTAITGATAGTVFLSTTAGGFTSTAPASLGNVVQAIGVATDATSINVEFKNAIELA